MAGPAALLVAKLHKIAERVDAGDQRRLDDKDAFDVLRLLRGTQTEALATTLAVLAQDPLARAVTQASFVQLRNLFSAKDAAGTQMAVEATRGVEDSTDIAASCVALATDLLEALSA